MGYEYLMQAYPETSSTLCFEHACDAVQAGKAYDTIIYKSEMISRVWTKPTGIYDLQEIGVYTNCGKSASCIVRSSDFPFSYLVMYYFVAIIKQIEDALRDYKCI